MPPIPAETHQLNFVVVVFEFIDTPALCEQVQNALFSA